MLKLVALPLVLGACLWALGAPFALAEPTPHAARTVLTNTTPPSAANDRSAEALAPEAATGTLPPLESTAFARASFDALRELDSQAERTLAALQLGAPCARIRDASRVPARTRLLSDHDRELSVAGALILCASLIAIFTRSAWGRAILALPPLLGALLLGRVTWMRLEEGRTAIREGLRACTAELPASDVSRPEVVEARWTRAVDLTDTISRVIREPSGQQH